MVRSRPRVRFPPPAQGSNSSPLARVSRRYLSYASVLQKTSIREMAQKQSICLRPPPFRTLLHVPLFRGGFERKYATCIFSAARCSSLPILTIRYFPTKQTKNSSRVTGLPIHGGQEKTLRM